MKRAWTKKIKAVPACAAGNDNLEKHLKPVQPVKRRVRTSATMIGLAFSMGASSLLLTRQSDRAPASEPLGNESKSSIVPAAAFAVTPSTSRMQLKPAVSTPAPPVVEHTIQKKQALKQPSQKYQVDTAALSRKVNRSQNTLAATSASQQLLMTESRRVTGEVNGAMLAKQKVTLNRLKQKSNRLKDILAELRYNEPHNSSAPLTESLNRLKEIVAELSEESNNLSAPDTKSMEPTSAVNTPTVVAASGSLNYRVRAGDTLTAIAHLHGISVAEIVKANNLTAPDRLQINQSLTIPGFQLRSNTVVATYTQHQAASLSPRRAISDGLPKFAVNTPTAVVASGLLKYQVRPGDTLTEIAHLHGVSLKALVNANHLTAPDWLQINQRLTIPAFKYSSAATPWAENASVPPEPLAGTPSLSATVYGIGGSISEDATNEATFDKSQLDSTAASQLLYSTATKLEGQQSNPYVKNLQTDIQRLQQKYYAQQTVGQVVPSSENSSVAVSQQVPAFRAINPQISPNLPAEQPTKPEFPNKQASETLKPAIQNRHPNQTHPVLPKARVVTAPIGVDASESLQSPREQVLPLPPLAAVDKYMPTLDNSAQFKGYIWPTKGVLSSGYGWRWGRMHKGIDIAAPIGTPVVAAAPGVVIKAGWNSGGYGRLVDIKHPDGTFTRYAHNNRILVRPGQQVEQGEPISEMGSSGRSTGPHLHFEVHPAGKGAVNPIAFLKRK